ncbi:MAG: hypothetical protein ACR2PS_13885, partial [Pseudomonadales bacterium]
MDGTTTTSLKNSGNRQTTTTFYPWYVVSILMLAQTCSFIDRMIMGLLVGPVRATFGISDT